MRSRPLVLLALLAAGLIAALALLDPGAGSRASLAAGRVGVGPESTGAALDPEPGAGAARPTRTAIEPVPEPALVPRRRPKPRPRVTGRVVDAAGRPLGGARVWATTSSQWARVPLDLEREAFAGRWLDVARAETDAEGRFAFDALLPGRVRLVARAAGRAPTYREALGELRQDDLDLGDIALDPGAAVAGVVLQAGGAPAPGVRVLVAADALASGGALSIPGHGVPVAETDAAGRFRVDELAPGPFELLFVREGSALARVAGRTQRAGEELAGFVVRLEPGAAISGRVRLKPGVLAGAMRVVARRLAPAADATQASTEEPQPEDGDAVIEARPRTAVVGPDGTFRVEGLLAGEAYRLTLAVKRGEVWHVAGARNVSAPSSSMEFVVDADAGLKARVVDDATGEPLEEFVVWWGVGRFRVLRDERNEVQRAWPGGELRCAEPRAPPPGRPAWLRISAPGRVDFERKDLVLVDGTEIDLGEIRVVAERRLVITVVDEQDLAVEGARVLVTAEGPERLEQWARTPDRQDLSGEVQVRTARTDEDGRAVLAGYPGRLARLTATAPGFAPAVAVEARQPRDADHAARLVLRRGARVTVVVHDGAGRAVAGAPVGHRPARLPVDRGQERFARVLSDGRGEARFEALEGGVHAFRLELEDGESAWFEADADRAVREEPWREVSLAESSDLRIDFVAPPRGTLAGVVREGGRVLEGAVVKLVPWVEGRESGWTWAGDGQDPFAARTNHRGEYRIENRRTGTYLALVHHPDRRMPLEQRLVLGAGEQLADFTLDANEIRGRVTDPEGLPIAGVRIQVERLGAAIEMEPPQPLVLGVDDRGQPRLERRAGGGARAARTDARGNYLLRGLVDSQPLSVSARGEDVEGRSLEPITLAPGEVRGGADFVLRRAGRVELTLQGALLEDHGYQVEIVAREQEGERVLRRVWLSKWDPAETVASIVPGRHALRLSRRDRQGLSTPLGEVEVEVEVAKLARAVLQVP
ncbi:MAG: carboxypeptidase regulatory-like domain-containing protein [Planctomycetes bacterium]|nr:carboxypeptidase regulatory-like domain-containing protein [Planctomycetota bacterium]